MKIRRTKTPRHREEIRGEAAWQLQPGDEVLVPSLTAFPSIEPMIHAWAVTVFCDVDDTYTIDQMTRSPFALRPNRLASHRRRHAPARARFFAFLVAGMLAASAIGCASGPAGRDALATPIDLTPFKTYMLQEPEAKSISLGYARAGIRDRVRVALDAQLRAKGVGRAGEGEQPDLLVTYRIISPEDIGHAPGGRAAAGVFRPGGYDEPGPVYVPPPAPGDIDYRGSPNAPADLIVELSDAHTGKPIWRNTCPEAIRGSDPVLSELERALEKAFRTLPSVSR